MSAFGLTGYLLVRFTPVAGLMSGLLAAVGATVAVATAVLLVKRWAVPHALRDNPDERYVLQGQLATVTHGIPFNGVGEIVYQIDEQRFTTRAQSIDGAPIDAGADVVIERVENGIVYVEDWTRVERRL
ncbi:MAG: hypothetical protein ACT4P7_15510 [Gemmatimonadaceae bacterium]